MRISRIAVLLAVSLLLGAGAARAEIIPLGTNGFGWQAFPTALDQTAPPYWDSVSADGANFCGIGHWILGENLSGCGNQTTYTPGPGQPLDWWGNSDGTADPNITFASTGDVATTLLIEIAGFRDQNTFGWYTYDGTTITRHELFGGPAQPVTSASFTPGSVFGFYLGLGDASTYYYTQSSLNTNIAERADQHFAIFQGASGYYIGAEDQALASGDHDYNDMIVSSVPEPASMVLFGTGLVGLAGVIRRRTRK